MHITLKRIPRDEFAKFIRKKFGESGLGVEGEVIEGILNITKGHPYYTQMLCQKLWLNPVIQGKKEVSRKDLEITLDEALN
ncbi:hypothetical protein [Thermococcus chitonophagus]|nr:hypothetical protein [Thermococcus chitonophagus]CUX76931.1 hypothetical protein CHITON_0152 [Thermococcus chitonophagus]